MIKEKNVKKYCCEDIRKIENYEQAVNDKTQSWDCHHRAEILPCGNFTVDSLTKFKLYWHRPAAELIFLTKSQHTALHCKNQSKETRERLSKSHLGKHPSEETKQKIRAGNIGKRNSEESKQKMREAHIGKYHSQESIQKMREVHIGKIWWNDGEKNCMAKECPGKSWHKGRLRKKK